MREKSLPVRAPAHGRIRHGLRPSDGRPEQGKSFLSRFSSGGGTSPCPVCGKKGMGLAEVLVAGAVGGIIIAGSMKSLSVSLQSAQVARSSLTETTLAHTLSRALDSTNCSINLQPKAGSTGRLVADTNPVTDPKNGKGKLSKLTIRYQTGTREVTKDGETVTEPVYEDREVVKTGEDFKGNFHIVKMALRGDATDPKAPHPDPAQRSFVVYYKKNNLGSFSTLGGGDLFRGRTQVAVIFKIVLWIINWTQQGQVSPLAMYWTVRPISWCNNRVAPPALFLATLIHGRQNLSVDL